MDKHIILAIMISSSLLLTSCDTNSTSSESVSSANGSCSSSSESLNDTSSASFDLEAEKYDYEEVPLIWDLCGTWHLNDTRYPDAEFSVSMDDNGTCYASFFNLMNEDTGAFCEFDDIALTESGNCIEGGFDTDSWGNSGTILIEFEPDPDSDTFGTFYLTINTTSYGEYKDSDRYASHVDHIALTSGDPPLNNETVFKRRLAAEQRSQALDINNLLRNPPNYADGSLYRFSGTIDYIVRDTFQSYGCLLLPGNQTILCFEYPGWLECIQGDFVLFYGEISNKIGQYQIDGTTYQTANIIVNDYILQNNNAPISEPILVDFEWNFICGTYQSIQDCYPLEKTITLTHDSFNGRPYTLKGKAYRVNGVDYSTHYLSDESLNLFIDTIDAFGYKTQITLSFNYRGDLTIMGQRTDESLGSYGALYSSNYDRIS